MMSLPPRDSIVHIQTHSTCTSDVGPEELAGLGETLLILTYYCYLSSLYMRSQEHSKVSRNATRSSVQEMRTNVTVPFPDPTKVPVFLLTPLYFSSVCWTSTQWPMKETDAPEVFCTYLYTDYVYIALVKLTHETLIPTSYVFSSSTNHFTGSVVSFILNVSL